MFAATPSIRPDDIKENLRLYCSLQESICIFVAFGILLSEFIGEVEEVSLIFLLHDVLYRQIDAFLHSLGELYL